MMLQDFLEQIGERPYLWAKRHGIPKSAVYRHLDGEPIRYDNAVRISEATVGVVTATEIMTFSVKRNHGDST